MLYKLGPGIVVKTENAAKPESQSSAYLKALLTKLPHVETCFDYGCGKLRYCDSISERTDTLAIVDSEIQLSRWQTLKGAKTSIRDLFGRSNRISVYNDQEFIRQRDRFDRAFCINVLSVIPILSVRRQVLKVIRDRLAANGACLFVVQYRNSDFTRMKAMPNAQLWRDGFLINSLRGYSFYGLIPPKRLISMLERAGFLIDNISLNEGSVYVWASRR